MRWAALFEDLEAQYASSDQLALESEVAERVRLDQSALTLTERLRGQMGATLKVRTATDDTFEGQLAHVGTEWVVLHSGRRSVLVPLQSAVLFHGLGRATAPAPTNVESKLRLTSALRALSRDRAAVIIHVPAGTVSATLYGTIDRVGKDFAEVALIPRGEYRRAGSVVEVVALPLHSIIAVVSQQ
ncbi:MAG TPA: hypothetical protein VFI97_01300 [Arthrobacter sp.]|nr:hypothetical protein [Arthrobacter sp.]